MTNTKKYIGGIATALILTVGLVGCGSRSETPAPSTTKAPVTTTTLSQSVMVDALVKVLQNRLGSGSRNGIIDIAKQACVVIDESGSVAAAIQGIINDPDIDYETGSDMAFIMGVSIPVFCPEYTAQADRLTGN